MSDNNKRIETIINLIRSDRTVGALLLAVILITIMGSLRPNTTRGIYEKRYWANKISWQNYADVVITGDSRVLGGISPGKMKETLKNMCIVNNVKELSMPKIGCGLDRLDWNIVRVYIQKVFADTDIEISVYYL